MNKIFKVIYSKTRHCYVVVSELAKSHCKTTQSHTVRSKTALTAAVLLTLGAFSFVGMPSVQADESILNNDFIGANDYYWYYDEKEKNEANKWKTYQYKATDAFNNRSRHDLPNYKGAGAKLPGAITAGLSAQAGQQTVTIGDRNAGASSGSVFIGEHSGYDDGGKNSPTGASNNYVTSVGFQSDATGWGSIAIGSNAIAENSKMTSDSVTKVGNYNTTGTVRDDTYSIEAKPTIEGASVALGYNAHSKDGNIAIGANSEATSTASDGSYLSVGNDNLKRRITNVAQGTDNSDVVTVGQMNDAIKQADNLNVNAGWGINVADENDPTNTGKGTKNVISLKHNLGTGYNDDEANGMIIGGLVEDRDPAKQYGAADANSVIVGAGKALASGKSSVVVGGLDNVASGATSVVVGGDNNNAAGNQSAVFGGRDNTAAGIASTAGGGIMNVANGQQAVALGGAYNYALGTSSTAIGGTGGNGMYGYSTSVNGNYSVSLAGGSTGTDALNGLAAGNQSVVTTANGTAVGYQATTNKEGTIAFGHDAGDVSGYAVTWKQRTDGKTNADHTTNDYTQVPDSVTPTTYKDAYYNRLVKVADGQDAHDVVVMEQLNNAKNDLKVNAGWGIKVNDVTTKNDDDKETTTKNVISLNRNLGTNYGNPWKGEGKVTFEAGGENSLILGGAASILFSNLNDNVKAGAYGKDSVLVGGFNNLIDTVANDVTQTGEDAVIVGGDTNTVTGLRSVIVGGYQNTVSGGHSIVIGGASNEADGGGAGVFGGQSNKAAGGYSSVLGGDHNEADGDWSSAIGGTTNTASGLYATTLGGINNDAKGNESVVVGGVQNVAIGEDSTVNGGAQNTSYGMSSYVAGGMNNMAFGNASVALGGIKSNVNAKVSTGIAGGSTEEKAITALAAGHQSVVTNSGVEWRKVTQEDVDAINQKLPSWSGFIYTEPEEPYTTYVLDKVSTAVGYQSTADAPGVIAFGHDKGDVASVAKKWKQKATMEVGDDYSAKFYDANHKEISAEDYYKLANADGTLNDYTQDPIGTENTTYQSAYYNRLVKAADGIDAHDAVVMEQLKPYTKSDASNVGANLKTYTVGDDGETITETDASNTAKTTNENAWGTALGTGKIADSTESDKNNPKANGSLQLVTGGTVYSYNKPVAVPDKTLQYVKEGKTTGENLGILDATLNDKNHNIKYYAVDETKLPKLTNFNGKDYSNEKNDGAKGMGSMAAGFNTHADGIASTVAGSYSGVINSGNAQGIDFRGAAALSYGTFNVNQNTDTAEKHSGVANSIVGQANMTTNSNAAIIYGAGNTVTDSYRPIKEEKAKAILSSSNPTELSKAMQDAVKESGGQVMVMGGGNNVESAYMSQVVGVGNTVKGNQVKNTKGEWGTDTSDTAIKDYNSEKSSQYNYVDGFNNEVINGKHDYIIGANNKLSGDSYDDEAAEKYSNESNIVFGDNHTLTNTKNAVIIGSSDTQMILDKGDNATAIGHNASAQRDALAVGVNTEAGGNAVALGTSTIAHNNSIAIGTKATAVSSQNLAIGWEAHIGNIKTDNEKIKNAVALGSDSQVKVNDLLESDNNRGVLSIGDKDKERRIIHVRAGVNDTDAVNVSQLKSVQSDLTGKGLKFAANSGDDYTAELGSKVKIQGTAKKENHEYTADNLTTEIDENGNITILMDKDMSVEKLAVNGKDGKEGAPGTPGSIGISGQDGESGIGIDGKDGISIKGKNGKDGVTIKGIDGVDGVDGAEGHIGLNGKDGMTDIFTTAGKPGLDGKDGETMTRIVYKDPKGTGHEVATLDDGLKFKGDDTTVINKKLNNTLDIIGGAKGDLTEGNIGINSTKEGKLKVQLAKDLTGITSISNQKTEGGKTTGAKITLGDNGSVDVNGGKITHVGSGIEKDATGNITEASKTNAANIGDVQTLAESTATSLTGKGLKFAANSGNEYTAKLGTTVKVLGTAKKEGHEYTADNLTTEIDENGNITILMDKNVSAEKIAVNGKDGENGKPGTAGSIGISGQDGKAGVGIDGKNGISIKGQNGKDGVTIKGIDGVDGVDGAEGHIGLNGKDGMTDIFTTAGKPGLDGKDGETMTRIVYKDPKGTGHEAATLDDGLKFKGDDSKEIAKKLNNTLDIIGGADSKNLTEGNIGVNSTDKGQLKVQLAKDLTGITSISNQTTTKVGDEDVTTGAKITLGTDGTTTISGGDVNVSGNKITHVGSGIETDANGKYTVTDQNKGNAANIGDVQNMVNEAVNSAADTTNKALAGKANIDASNIGAHLKNADGSVASAEDQKTNAEKWGSAIGTGEIKADDGRMVTGKTVYDEVRPTEDGSYVKKDKTTGENLSALDSKIGKLDNDGNYIKKDDSVSKNLSTLDTQVKNNAESIQNITNNVKNLSNNAVQYDEGSNKTKVTLGGAGGTTITNVKDGALNDSSTDAVNGKQLYAEQTARKELETKVTSNTTEINNIKDGQGFTDKGKEVIRDLAKGSVKVIAGTNTTVTPGTDEDGATTYAVNVEGKGKVASGDTGLISGGTLYKEVHVDTDGSYIKGSQTVGQNLSALDTGLKTTSDLIHTNTKGDTIQIGGNSTATRIDVNGKDGKGRVITGVVSDANDPNSAANVGYVNGLTAANTQQIYRDMNNAYSRLDTNINRAAAGSNALAALHPLDFDPADKASFAVGYGHYRNANAAAVGAFYQPNANTMVNMGISLGNGDPGFNAGVSFKIGKGSAYNGVSKAEMAQTIHDQATEISAIKANDAAKDKRIDALEKENQEMKKQIQEILARLNG